MTRPPCAGCDGSGWLVPLPGPEEARRCACNQRPAPISHRSEWVGGRPLCNKRDADRYAQNEPVSFGGDVTCPECLKRMR